MSDAIISLLEKAITFRYGFAAQGGASRSHLFDERHENAFRLFNGFFEGYPEIK